MSKQTPARGELIVALTADGQNVVINHPDLKPDADGVGHIVFSPDQAVRLALLLWNKANVIRLIACGHCGDPLTQKTGWATAQFAYCFKEECQREFYKEAQAMIRKVDPHTAELLAAATNTQTFTCPKCSRVSHNPNDARERFCGACNEFFK